MKKILLVSNTDWSFWKFRIQLIHALVRTGWDVVVVTPGGKYQPLIEQTGARTITWPLDRKSWNPFKELLALWRLARIYAQERPTVVHHFTIKPNIYGTLAATILRVPWIINTWTGLGYMFSSALPAKMMRVWLIPFIRVLYRQSRVYTVFLNPEDQRQFLRLRLIHPARTMLLLGEGVDTKQFSPTYNSRLHPPVVFMACRLLWDKGLGEFVEAARRITSEGIPAQFWVAGEPDFGNPRSVLPETLEKWKHEGIVKFLGYREDIDQLLKQVSISVLPSYHEGVPVFLLEAMASGVPVVATDIPGIRVAVQSGIHGFLIPPRDAGALTEAIRRLLLNPDLRLRMGREARKHVERNFNRQEVTLKWLNFYSQILKDSGSFSVR